MNDLCVMAYNLKCNKSREALYESKRTMLIECNNHITRLDSKEQSSMGYDWFSFLRKVAIKFQIFSLALKSLVRKFFRNRFMSKFLKSF